MTFVSSRITRRALLATGTALALGHQARAFARQTPGALPDGPLREHIAWFIDMLNDTGEPLAATQIEQHFSPGFLDHVPAEEIITTIEQLRAVLGHVEVGRVARASDEQQAGVQLLGSTGVVARLTMWLDPATNLIGGLLIEPEDAATDPAATPAATAAASPVAVTPAPQMDDVLPRFRNTVAALTDQGHTLMDALFAGDNDALADLVTPELLAVLGSSPASTLLSQLQTNVLHMELPMFGAVFDGFVTPEQIAGHFHQQGPGTFQLSPDQPQQDDLPAGRWTGTINGILPVAVAFSGDADTLAATFSVPSQGISDEPLTNVTLERERPIGERLAERALPLGAATFNNSWSGQYEWGPSDLVISISFDSDGIANALTTATSPPLPPDPAAGMEVATPTHLPFEGSWLVIWGGDTEFRNYHAAVPFQRHACDIVIWRDGATYEGDGTRNEHYHAWGQPVLAPADGTVVSTLDGLEDTTPGTVGEPGAGASQASHPAGNHVVIMTGDEQYLLIGHLRQGTVVVAEGDRVNAGDLLGQCGSSGNATEPHIHIQAQNQADLFGPATISLPLVFTDLIVDGDHVPRAELTQGQLIAPAWPPTSPAATAHL